jgi:hypothetical protein
MKAVIYHADGPIAKNYPVGTYDELILGLKENCNKFNIPLIHITLAGFKGLGDINYYYEGDPSEIIYNREKFFIEFLKQADDDVYWFTEPDSRIINVFPELSGDLAMLLRSDEKRLNAAWRLCKKSAIPFFEEVLENFDLSNKTWNGDSVAYSKIWELIGSPDKEGYIRYKNFDIELRSYKQYCSRKGYYTQQFKSNHKNELLKR